MLAEPVDRCLPAVRLGERPVRLLAEELLVEVGHAVFQGDELGDQRRRHGRGGCIDVRLDGVRIAVEDAPDDDLVLAGEVAPGAVGDGAEAGAHRRHVVRNLRQPVGGVAKHSAQVFPGKGPRAVGGGAQRPDAFRRVAHPRDGFEGSQPGLFLRAIFHRPVIERQQFAPFLGLQALSCLYYGAFLGLIAAGITTHAWGVVLALIALSLGAHLVRSGLQAGRGVQFALAAACSLVGSALVAGATVHWKTIRTTNVIERLFNEVKKRSHKMAAAFRNEDSCLLMFYAVIRSLKLRRISVPAQATSQPENLHNS